MKSGAEGGPIEISGTAKAGNGSRQFRFEVARLFPLLFRVVLFTSIAQLLGPNRAGDKRGDRDSPSSITHCSHF